MPTQLMERPPSVTLKTPPASTRHSGDVSRWLVVGAILLGTFISSWMAWNRIFSPDEFEVLHQGWLIANGQLIYHDFNSNHPPIYFLLMSLIPRVTEDAVHCLRAARLASVALFLLDATLIYRLASLVSDRRAARWAVIFFMASATMWEWAMEVRTDTVLVPLWLASLCLLIEPRPLASWLRFGGVGLLMGIAFWTNQKAVLHGTPLAAWMAYRVWKREWRWTDIAVSIVAFLAVNGIVVGWIFYLGIWHDLKENLFTGGSDLVKAKPYAVFRGTTLRQFVMYDAGLALLSACAMLGLFRRWPSIPPLQRLIVLGAVWMTFTFWITPGPFGYYFLSILPLTVLTIGCWLSRRMDEQGFRSVNSWGMAAVVLVYLAPPSAWLEEVVPHTNHLQSRALRLGLQLVDRETRVFDFSGSLVSRPDAYPFHTRLSPKEVHRFRHKLPPVVETLRSQRVPLLIASDRFSFPAFDQGQSILKRHFVTLWGPLWVPGYDSQDEVGSEPHAMELWYDGAYESDTPGLQIDGKPFENPMRLTAGRHSLEIRDNPPTRVILRDASYHERIDLPTDTHPLSDYLYLHWIYERLARGR